MLCKLKRVFILLVAWVEMQIGDSTLLTTHDIARWGPEATGTLTRLT